LKTVVCSRKVIDYRLRSDQIVAEICGYNSSVVVASREEAMKNALALSAAAIALLTAPVASAGVVYDNTTTLAGIVFAFDGATLTGTNLATNVDVNELTLAAGSAGEQITSLSFIAFNRNRVAVETRPTMYVWAANGAGGDPGTLLGSFALPLETFSLGETRSLSLTVPTTLIVPASLQIWAGLGFDNDNGASAITAAQLNELGGPAFHPATVGTDGATALFIMPPTFAVDNPATAPFGSSFGANFGWTVSAAAVAVVPEPSTWAMLLAGFAGLGFAGWRARGGFRLAA
jgi:hypothetical protein